MQRKFIIMALYWIDLGNYFVAKAISIVAMVARVEILDCFVGKFEDSFADFATANKTLIAINPKY